MRMGSVGRAANALAVSQPALSRTLHRLEARLGAQLFVRHSTGMELTAFGRALQPHAELIESETRRTREEIDALKGSSKGLVRIGAVPSISSNILPLAVSSAYARSPSIRINVVEDTGTRLVAALVRGDIDFAITGLWREPIDENVTVTRLFEDEVCVMGRWAHPISGGVPLKDLQAYPWAMPEKGNIIRDEFHLMFRRAGLTPPSVAVETNSVHALKSVVADTDFLTMLARSTFRLEEKAGLLRPMHIAEGHWRRQLGILRRSTGRLLPAASMLYTDIRRIAGSLS